MIILRLIPMALAALLATSCATYKEPTDGPMATLTCKQPPYASLIALPSAPVSRIKSIDGKELPALFVSAQQSVKVAVGNRVVTATATAGPYRSGASFAMVFKDGENYYLQTVATNALDHRYEVRDSKGKLVATAKPVFQTVVSPPMMIFIPAG